jgi:diaminopimelate epimerase
MCGNGGRCLVASQKKKVIGDSTTFNAVDGLHASVNKDGIVSLQMIDVLNIKRIRLYLSDTGLTSRSGSR